MALSLDELKDLIVFGRAQGLQQLIADGVSIVYGMPLQLAPESEQKTDDEQLSKLPPELRHYSAAGKSAWGHR